MSTATHTVTLAGLAAVLMSAACDKGGDDSVALGDTQPVVPPDDTGISAPVYEGDYALAEATTRLYAVEEQQHSGRVFGWAVAARDIDDDGRAELLLGALGALGATEGDDVPGAAYLFAGLEAGAWTTADAEARLFGESHGSYTGLGVALGDLDGDGWGDLVVGAPLEPSGGEAGGAVYVQLSGMPGLPG